MTTLPLRRNLSMPRLRFGLTIALVMACGFLIAHPVYAQTKQTDPKKDAQKGTPKLDPKTEASVENAFERALRLQP